MDEPNRIRKHLRSRKGCFTCRTKKVKCDEQRPSCRRCSRLELQCDWTDKTKGKHEVERPKKLLPSAPSLVAPCSISQVDADLSTETPDSYALTDATSLLIGYQSPFDETAISFYDPKPVASQDSRLPRPLENLSGLEIALQPSFQVTSREYRALHHFQTDFSLSRTTKSPWWSTHSLMLRLGLGTPMVMHLIIASALTDLSLCSDDSTLYALGQRHYEAGANLLVDAVGAQSQNHVDILSSFFLLYVCMSLREESLEKVSQLSWMVLNHVQTFDLVGYSSDALETIIPQDQRAFIARMMVWLVYEDIAAAFLGCDGAFARYLRSQPEKLDTIYEQSATILESCWGKFYPDSEAIDDVENSTVLRFLFDVMCLLQDINQLQDASEGAAIEQKLNALEVTSRPLLRLTTVRDSYASRLLSNVDWSVTLFHALRIYLFRATDEVTSSPSVQHALSSLLRIAQRRLSSGSNELLRRFEMPLFMAGVETDDPIHREWAQNKLTGQRYKRSMIQVLRLQREYGTRAPWATIRDAFRGTPCISSRTEASETLLLQSTSSWAALPP